MKRTIFDWIKYGTDYLQRNGVENAKYDAEIMLMELLNYDRVKLIISSKEYINEDIEANYIGMLEKRANGKPLQYILNNQEFMGLNFYVDKNVLIPRQDTEILVETAMEYIKIENMKVIMDMCTGSGCIPISLCSYIDGINAIGVDISKDALSIAIHNSKINNVSKKISWICSDLFENIPKNMYNSIDAIISNPPYIPTNEITTLMREVRDFEPTIALDGGEDGLLFYNIIIRNSLKFLKNNGRIFFEVGYNQSEIISTIMEQVGYVEIKIIKDLVGVNRVVIGKKNNEVK